MYVPFSKSHTFTRNTVAGDYVNGEWTAGTDTTITAKVSIQPYRDGVNAVRPREGGRWLSGMVSVDSESELFAERQASANSMLVGDRFTFQNETYEIIMANPEVYGRRTDHYECYGQKINGNTYNDN